MKLTYTTASGRLQFELETTGGKQAFEIVAAIQELFEEPHCGCCKSKDIHCNVREFNGNKYFKMQCMACNAQLDFGQNKDGRGLFVKKWDKESRAPMPNGGWYIYQGNSSGGGNGSNSGSQQGHQQSRPAGDDGSDPIPF